MITCETLLPVAFLTNYILPENTIAHLFKLLGICPFHWIDQRLNTKTAASFDRIKNQNVQKNAKIATFSRKIQTILQENNNKYIYCLVFSI